jgi:RNA polymerase sigma-70 factor (ECF subfamily)
MNDLEFDIADCVERVRLGDQEAARLLVQNLSPLVTGIVRRKLPRGVAEEDLVQEIFSKVFEKLDQYRGEVPFIHWVSRIAVNHSLNAIRSQKARPEWRMADLPEEQEAALEQKWMDTRQPHPGHAMASQEWVDKILATLDPEDCWLIRMLDVEEFSIAEVQQTTGWSAAYIRLRAFRARRKLNRRFGRLNKRQPTVRRISSGFSKSQISNLEFEISC